MTIKNVLLFGLAGCICFASGLSAAAQELAPSTTRGTAKVQIRYFNPFDVGSSRLDDGPLWVLHGAACKRIALLDDGLTGSRFIGRGNFEYLER